MNEIKPRADMERDEYAALMIGAENQRFFARGIKYNRELVPQDMLCYHGNRLLGCDSQNCMVDSGRAAGMSFFARE